MKNPTIDVNGRQYWYMNGKIHREDGPAYIGIGGSEEWYFNGLLHREDGPAIIMASGRQRWFVNGNIYRDNKSFQKADNLSDEDMLMITLKYGNVG